MVNYPAQSESEHLAEKPYNAADKEQVQSARKRTGRKRREELDYIRNIMSTPLGRAWMFNLLGACKTFSSPIVAGDAYYTYHNIGEQNIGKKLLQDINDASPDEYVLMLKEARNNK